MSREDDRAIVRSVFVECEIAAYIRQAEPSLTPDQVEAIVEEAEWRLNGDDLHSSRSDCPARA